MATLLQLATGQLDLRTVADKLNTAPSLFDLQTRQGGLDEALPVVFPEEFHGFQYLRFRGTFPYAISAVGGTVDILFTCYGTPVITSNQAWVTGIGSLGEINGQGSETVSVLSNAGAARSATITITVTQPLGTYVIFTTIEQAAAIATTPVSLGYDLSVDENSCQDFAFNPETFYVPSGQTFGTTSVIYTNSNGSGSPPSGYYSDGNDWRFWNGGSFTSTGSCVI